MYFYKMTNKFRIPSTPRAFTTEKCIRTNVAKIVGPNKSVWGLADDKPKCQCITYLKICFGDALK